MALLRPLKIGIVAGEMSGDFLGAGLIAALKKRCSSIEFVGIGGPKMIHEGFQSFVPMEKLSVMGITDVLRRYFALRKIRQQLVHEFIRNPPDLFVGIDYPGFNLALESRLKAHGIKTVHYVSPKIWAWRQKRVLKIKKAVDLILTLFSFEKAFYDKHNVPVQFVGHPLADEIAPHIDNHLIKQRFGYTAKDRVIAILPGSRVGELKYMGPLYLDVIEEINKRQKDIHFIVPMANKILRKIFEDQIRVKHHHLNIKIIDGQARDAMAASNLVIVKAGTATLEAMLLKRPMIVAFKWNIFTHAIIAPQLKIPFCALPNLLANQYIVPEFIQKNAKAKDIADAALAFYDDEKSNTQLIKQHFEVLYDQLRQNANQNAAQAILRVINL